MIVHKSPHLQRYFKFSLDFTMKDSGFRLLPHTTILESKLLLTPACQHITRPNDQITVRLKGPFFRVALRM